MPTIKLTKQVILDHLQDNLTNEESAYVKAAVETKLLTLASDLEIKIEEEDYK